MPIDQIAKLIQSMTYSEMMQLASELAPHVNTSQQGPVINNVSMLAHGLFTWASNHDEAEDE